MPFIRYAALPAWLRLMRPEQWTKNVVVMAALFFAFWDPSQHVRERWGELLFLSLAATALFSLVSSAIYSFNDCRDRVADRLHPVKRLRPVAAGEISPRFAYGLSFVLSGAGVILSFLLSVPFGSLVAVYVLLQALYTLRFKHVPLLDVFIVALGFVLRALAGAAVLAVRISPWLVLCTFLLALFLALCKRRQEKKRMDAGHPETRRVLHGYDPLFLDQLISISAGATIVCYAIYTLWPDTVERFGTPCLGFTIPFVVFGIFRYLQLVYGRDFGERPERILLTDAVMIVTVLLFLATFAAVVFL